MLLEIEGRASIGRRRSEVVAVFATKQLRSCDVAKMTITKWGVFEATWQSY